MLNLVKEKESKRLSADQLVASGGWDDCETLIATPVIAGDKIFGMLTLDAPKVGDLLEVELAAMRLYAQLLAAGLAS